jgi:GSH-dependent disulfide-bond oxidoreductase
MTKSITDFTINARWPAKNPDILQLYSVATPNGRKASIMLEEIGLPYEAHYTGLSDDAMRSPEYLSLNPNNKIPAIIDPHGPDGEPMPLFESGAILIYLAEKTGKLLGKTKSERYQIIQWVMWQMGGLGPMLGQLGFFVKFAGKDIEDPRPRERYIAEAKRLLAVLDKQLEGKDWVMGEYSIADIAIAPWVFSLEFYGAKGLVGYDSLKNVPAYVERFFARPAVQRGKDIPESK